MRTGLRVLLVAEFYGSGGTRTYLRQLLDFYARRDAQVTLVSVSPQPDAEIVALASSYGVTVTTYGEVMAEHAGADAAADPPVWSYRGMRRERRAFAAFARAIRADCVVVSAGTPGMFLGALGAVPRGIYILHTYPHGRRQELLGPLYMSRFLPPGATIVSVSDFERRAIERLWRPSRSGVEVITIKNSCGPITDARVEAKAPPAIVLTASWVEYYKQPMHWIDVAEAVVARLPDSPVTFTWLGEGSLLEPARQRAAASPAAHAISFPGMTSEVEDWYDRSRLYLQLSAIENMSLSTIDAQRHGIPCVVTDVGGLPEIVTNGSDGIVVPVMDVEATAAAIVDLLEDEPRWTRYANAAREHYEAEHSPRQWEQSLATLHGAY